MRYVIVVGAWIAFWAQGSVAWGQEAPAAGQLVSIEVLLADAIGPAADGSDITADKIVELDKQGKLAGASRIKLSLVENVPASANFGETTPLVSSRQDFGGGQFGGGRGGTSYSMQNLGTTVQATARVEEDGKILVELSVERSRLAPAKPAEGDAAPPPRQLLNHSTRTTVRVASGQSALVGGQQTVAGSEAAQTYVVLTAHAAEPAKAADAVRPAPALKVFALTHAKAAEIVLVLRSVFERQGLKLAADERTNSIIAQGSDEQLDIASSLIQRLDAQQ